MFRLYLSISRISSWSFPAALSVLVFHVFVDALVVVVFSLCENHTLIVFLDSSTPTGIFE